MNILINITSQVQQRQKTVKTIIYVADGDSYIPENSKNPHKRITISNVDDRFYCFLALLYL